MSEPFLAEIRIVSFQFAPKGWAFCNGQLLPINQNQALFALLGTTYGGDGRVTFALPNLQGRTPIHVGNGHVLGERAGEQAHTLTVTEVPAHTHSAGLAGTTADADSQSPVGTRPAVASIEMYAQTTPQAPMHPLAATAVAGGSQAHTNMQPFLALNFVIALVGIFPSQN
jgi:microcystin-dependent protein